MSDNKGVSPVVKHLKQASEIAQDIYEIQGLPKFRIVPVSIQLIEDVGNSIKDPEAPIWNNPNKEGRAERNPSDPEYLAGLAEARRMRNAAIMDAMVMMGIEIVDGVPDDDEWVKKLRSMEKRGLLSIDGYDLEDPIDREFLFKRYFLATGEVIELVSRASGATEEVVARAEASFPGN